MADRCEFFANEVREFPYEIPGVDWAVVVLQRSNTGIRIEVRDEGKGFNIAALTGSNRSNIDEEEPGQWSFGLPTLRHQLSLLGGQMEIQSEPDAGTCITLTMPDT